MTRSELDVIGPISRGSVAALSVEAVAVAVAVVVGVVGGYLLSCLPPSDLKLVPREKTASRPANTARPPAAPDDRSRQQQPYVVL